MPTKYNYYFQVKAFSYEGKAKRLKKFENFVREVVTLKNSGMPFQKIAEQFKATNRQTFHKIYKANKDNPLFK